MCWLMLVICFDCFYIQLNMSIILIMVMIFVVGCGEWMCLLIDICLKLLFEVGGKLLIVWQIEVFVWVGIEIIVINYVWFGVQFEVVFGDGLCWGVWIVYLVEGDVLEIVGGIVQVLLLLECDGQLVVFVVVSGDVYCVFDYWMFVLCVVWMVVFDMLVMYFVMVLNLLFYLVGDFVFGDDGCLVFDGVVCFMFGNIGLYDMWMFCDFVFGMWCVLMLYYCVVIEVGYVSGELYEGIWENVGMFVQFGEFDVWLCVVVG